MPELLEPPAWSESSFSYYFLIKLLLLVLLLLVYHTLTNVLKLLVHLHLSSIHLRSEWPFIHIIT